MTSNDDGGWAAFPGADPTSEGRDEEATSTVEVDGEIFELQPDGFRGTHYTWLSGPNPGYGFSMSPTPDLTEEHEANIRSFLSMVDPTTGFIEDE